MRTERKLELKNWRRSANIPTERCENVGETLHGSLKTHVTYVMLKAVVSSG